MLELFTPTRYLRLFFVLFFWCSVVYRNDGIQIVVVNFSIYVMFAFLLNLSNFSSSSSKQQAGWVLDQNLCDGYLFRPLILFGIEKRLIVCYIKNTKGTTAHKVG
jgi:hypothetical protein